MAKGQVQSSNIWPSAITGFGLALILDPSVGFWSGVAVFTVLTIADTRKNSGRKSESKTRVGVSPAVSVSMSDQYSRKTRTVSLDDESYVIGESGRSGAGQHRFISRDQSLSIGGFSLAGPLYTGKVGRDCYNEPSVIDPSLKISSAGLPDELGYWPNYSALAPRQRYEYLHWLSGARDGIDQLGYVFLYLYGFERYVLVDAVSDIEDVRRKNLEDIFNEVVRLRGVFRSSASFDGYSHQLLDLIAIKFLPEKLVLRSRELPPYNAIAYRHAIITQANSNRDDPLDADWALQWLIACGGVGRTKAVKEHYQVLRALFRARYELETNGGIKIPKCKTRARLRAVPAARGLDFYSDIPYPNDWFDPTNLKGPLNKLEPIFKEVMPAVRNLAKAMKTKDPVAILSAWPSELPLSSAPKLKQFADRIEEVLDRNLSVPVLTLAKLFRIDVKDKLSLKQLRDISAVLSSCGRVSVPDPNINSVSLKSSDSVVTYKGTRLVAMSPEGARISTAIQLGSMLALSDGAIHERETAILKKVVASHSNPEEREYLAHYLEWRLKQKPNATGLKAQIDRLESADKAELGRILVDIAIADGELPSSEIKELEKLFKRLGLETTSVTAMLHDSAATSPWTRGGVLVEGGQVDATINDEALEAHRKSTAEVQDVLSSIFRDEDAEDTPEHQLEKEEPPRVAGGAWHGAILDDAHAALYDWLITSDEWPMGEVEQKCAALGLMAEGALTQINEAAFDVLGDSLIEISDPVEVYRDVIPS